MTEYEIERVKEALYQRLEYQRRGAVPGESFCLYMNQATFDSLAWEDEKDYGYLAIRDEEVPVVIDNSIATIMQESSGAKVYSSDVEVRPLPTFGRVPK